MSTKLNGFSFCPGPWRDIAADLAGKVSEHGLNHSREGFVDSLQDGARLPRCRIYFGRVAEIAIKHAIHFLPKARAQDRRVDFVVACDAPPIEVGGTDG